MSHRPGLKQCSRAGPLAHCSSASSHAPYVILATLGRAWPKNSTTANAEIITRARVRQHERPQPPAAAGVAPQQFNVQVVGANGKFARVKSVLPCPFVKHAPRNKAGHLLFLVSNLQQRKTAPVYERMASARLQCECFAGSKHS